MITIGFSTKKIDQKFVEHIKTTIGPKNIEIIPIENPGKYSLTEAYNMILEQSTNDIVVLCHDDIYFEKKGWGNKLIKHFNRNPEYGILGVAGTKYLPKSGLWWEVQSEMIGIVNHEHDGKKWTSKYSRDLGNKIDDVVITDGVFMVVNKTVIKEKFNTKVEGFHFYDVDFTYRNFLKDVKVGVIFDIRITHKSIGMPNQQWQENRVKFVSEFHNTLPVLLDYKFMSYKVDSKKEPITAVIRIENTGVKINNLIENLISQTHKNIKIHLIDAYPTEYTELKMATLSKLPYVELFDKENTKDLKTDYILSISDTEFLSHNFIEKGIMFLKKHNKLIFHGKAIGYPSGKELLTQVDAVPVLYDKKILGDEGYFLRLLDERYHNTLVYVETIKSYQYD